MAHEEIEARHQKRLKEIDEWYARSVASLDRREAMIDKAIMEIDSLLRPFSWIKNINKPKQTND